MEVESFRVIQLMPGLTMNVDWGEGSRSLEATLDSYGATNKACVFVCINLSASLAAAHLAFSSSRYRTS